MKETYEGKIESLWKRVSHLISKAKDPQQIILGIAKETTKTLGADAASVRLLKGEDLTLVGGYRLSEEYKAKIPLRIGEGLVGKVARLRKPLFSQNIEEDSKILYPEVGKREGIVSLMCTPVLAEDKLLGTLTVYSKKKRSWSEKESEVLTLLAEQLALNLERMRDLQVLKEKSIRDELTGLYSRSYFLARAREEITRSSREEIYPSFLFCDVDDFKAINRIKGYAEGDKVLCQTAKTIKSSLREEDTLCRYGGDEFVVLLPKTDPFQAEKIAERIHQAFLRAKGAKNYSSLGISIGIASYPIHGNFIEDILAKADRSMIFAKHHPQKKTFIWDEWKVADTKELYKEEVLPEVIYALAETVNMKNGYTGGHSKLVSEMALELAEKVGLKEERIKRIRTASLLHDIGKFVVPTHILNKPGSLTEKEKKIVRKHAENSAKIVQYVRGLKKIVPIVRAIHERWDGEGYPDGLAGDEIPLEARIIALVDVYQALISDRPYRKRLSKKEAIKKLQEGAGKQFDPKLAEVFLEVLS
ncbi:MAG: diguanylate cyclase [Candidatus Aerophobetes bacterium]|nr:diguanylate cyclase [Candidatus Aerophobetes bacterium]